MTGDCVVDKTGRHFFCVVTFDVWMRRPVFHSPDSPGKDGKRDWHRTPCGVSTAYASGNMRGTLLRPSHAQLIGRLCKHCFPVGG